ncbi:hypothetical protein [Martelella sp. FOR1707]
MSPLNSKGPISAVTLPGQSSSNQFEDGMKNHRSNSTEQKKIPVSVLPEGTDSEPLFPRGDLGELSMADLDSLQRALHTVGDVVAAISCQPRFFNSEEREYTPAGVQVVRLLEALGVWETRIFNTAATASPNTCSEVEAKAWCMISYNAGYPDDLTDFSMMTRQAELDHLSAKRREASR